METPISTGSALVATEYKEEYSMKTFYDREKNPAVLISVRPIYSDRSLPVALFVQYRTRGNISPWQRYGEKEYRYPGAARNAAKMLEMSHYAWKYIKEEVPENV